MVLAGTVVNRRFYAGRSGDGNWGVFVLKVAIPREAGDLGFLAADPSNRSHRALRDLGEETIMSAADPNLGRDHSSWDRRFDQSNLLGAGPSLDLLLPFNRITQLFEAFEPGDAALRRQNWESVSACIHELVAQCCLSFPGKFSWKHWT